MNNTNVAQIDVFEFFREIKKTACVVLFRMRILEKGGEGG